MSGDERDDKRDALWESEARGEIQAILETIAFDEGDGKVYVSGPWGYKGDEAYEEFESADALRDFLVEVGDQAMTANAPYEDGEPVFDMDSSDIVDEELSGTGAYEFFESKNLVVQPEQLLAQVPAPQVASGELVVKEVSEELIKYLAKHPEKMRSMAPRKFEELVAELFRDMGYQVELTAPSKDGGRDILALRKDAATTLLTQVECKRYAAHRSVGVGLVRALHGVVSADQASHGIIATTTFFTKGAKQFAAKLPHRLSLKDFNAVVEWLKNYKKGEVVGR
jgi:HJR/Mrr/RecB family endonuclease